MSEVDAAVDRDAGGSRRTTAAEVSGRRSEKGYTARRAGRPPIRAPTRKSRPISDTARRRGLEQAAFQRPLQSVDVPAAESDASPDASEGRQQVGRSGRVFGGPRLTTLRRSGRSTLARQSRNPDQGDAVVRACFMHTPCRGSDGVRSPPRSGAGGLPFVVVPREPLRDGVIASLVPPTSGDHQHRRGDVASAGSTMWQA
jgi:hypothetical protein